MKVFVFSFQIKKGEKQKENEFHGGFILILC